MTYRVIKTIRGRQYLYEQTSVRVGKKVKTISKYLSPANSNKGSANSNELWRGDYTDEEMKWKGWLNDKKPNPGPAPTVAAPEDKLPTANVYSVLPSSLPGPSSAETSTTAAPADTSSEPRKE